MMFLPPWKRGIYTVHTSIVLKTIGQLMPTDAEQVGIAASMAGTAVSRQGQLY